MTFNNFNINNIPQELIDLKQWVAWKGEKNDNGKMKKIPVNPVKGGYAKTNDKRTWGSFADAVNYCQEHELDGVGFVFTKKDPFVGVDLDDCINGTDGSITPDIEKLIKELRSYTEISPSGKGIHVIAKGKLNGPGRKNDYLEIYDANRFFTMTGNRLSGTPDRVSDCKKTVKFLYDRHFSQSRDAVSKKVLNEEDQALIQKAMSANNGNKFKALWQGYDYGYASASEADLALCRILAFWTGGDRTRIDRLFKQSGLYRPKWDKTHYSDGPTYGDATIQKAIDSLTDTDQPVPETSSSHDDAKNFKMTDLGNAERFVHYFGDIARYCNAWKSWVIWDGTRWKIDETEKIKELAKRAIRFIYQEALEFNDDGKRALLVKHALSSERETRILAMVNLAKSSLSIIPDEFDADPFLLNCENGTVDLRTGKLLLHRKKDFITKLVPVKYDERALTPRWDDFLARIMDGNQDLIDFLQRSIGYAMTGDISEQCLFIFFGSGSNGKSTFLRAIGSMLGDYAQQMPTETLMVKRSGGIPNDVARLKGARFITASEAEAEHRLAESLVKQMTGGDVITARFLHREWFDFEPTHKIFLGTNHKPVIRGSDYAIWRRIRLVPFEVTISEEERDLNLIHKLQEEISGILAWAVKGCLAWQKQGLGVPEEVSEATAEYKDEMDLLNDFLEERCLRGPHLQALTKDLYEEYRQWCEMNGDRTPSKRSFGLKLQEKNFKPIRIGGSGSRGWRGLCLR